MPRLLAAAVLAAHAGLGAARIVGNVNFTIEWRQEQPMPFAVSDQSATTLGDAIYLVGGCIQDQESHPTEAGWYVCPRIGNATLRFDVLDGTYTRLADAPRERYRHAAVGLGEKVYVLGGRDVNDTLVTAVDVLDTAAGTWSSFEWEDATSDLAAFVDGDTIFAVGGYDADYNTLTRMHAVDVSGESPVWVQTRTQDAEGAAYGAMTTPRGDFAIATHGRRAYAFGGWNADFCSAIGTIEEYDMDTGVWAAIPAAMRLGRGDKAFAVVNGRIFVIGGETKDDACFESVPVSDVESFDLSARNWYVESSIPASRFRFPAALHGSTIYTFGGQHYYDEDCNCYPVADEVASFTEHYTLASDGPAPASRHGALALSFLAAAAAAALAVAGF